LPYIWVMSKSVASGGIANLYAYFRRLYDLQKQKDKTVVFKIDGTPVQTVVTNNDGVARYLYPTVEAPGAHTIRCEFGGDAWVEAGYGNGTLTIL
ncbi:MAG: Ig-like domain repeat protein, partial [Chthonomonadales bacterium]|nr:Ig-like domain repeat protein [Chthonomonadales bacterium]